MYRTTGLYWLKWPLTNKYFPVWFETLLSNTNVYKIINIAIHSHQYVKHSNILLNISLRGITEKCFVSRWKHCYWPSYSNPNVIVFAKEYILILKQIRTFYVERFTKPKLQRNWNLFAYHFSNDKMHFMNKLFERKTYNCSVFC